MSGRQQRYNVAMVDNSKRIDELKKELARDSRSRQFYQLGELLRRDGRLNEAAEVLRGGLKHHVRYVAAWVALGRTCLDLGHGRENEAADALAQALGLDAHNPVAWRLLGEARLACGQRGAALEAMERALALVPGDEVLKAAVEALKAEAAPAAPVVERRTTAARAEPQALPVESVTLEAPFAFEAAPLELEASAEPAAAAPVPEEPGGPVEVPPAETPAGEPCQPEQALAVTDEAPALVSPEQTTPTEAPFRDETVPADLPVAGLAAEPVHEAAPSADVFDVFGGPSGPEAAVAEGVEPVAAAPPAEAPPQAWAGPSEIQTEPEPAAVVEPEPPDQVGVVPPPVEPELPEVATAETSAAEPTPEAEPVLTAPAPLEAETVVAEGVEPASAALPTELQAEESAPLELPAEASAVAPESYVTEEEVPSVVLVGVSSAEPERAAGEVVCGGPEPGAADEEAAAVEPVEELQAEPEAVGGAAGEGERASGAIASKGAEAPGMSPPQAESVVVGEAPVPVALPEESPASITLARLYLHQQQMGAAVEVLERLLEREPDNHEAADLLVLVRDLMEEAPAPQVSVLPVAERKIAALQRWLARIEPGRERMTR